MVVLLMGVSGAGKTTVGTLLAARLGWEFADADDYHPATNVEKMRNGTPLTDADRLPWIEALRGLIAGWVETGTNAVLACSALRETYRERLQVSPSGKFVYLKGSRELLWQRLHSRVGHFMTERMLDSQLSTLEEPDDAIVVEIDGSPDQIVAEIIEKSGLKAGA